MGTDTRRDQDEFVIQVPNPFPKTQSGWIPPKIPNTGTIVIGKPGEEKPSMIQKFSVLGCLVQLVILLLVLWSTTCCVAVVALLR